MPPYGVSSHVLTDYALQSEYPLIDVNATGVSPKALDGKVHQPQATVTVAFDRLMDTATTVIKVVRVVMGNDYEVAVMNDAFAGSDVTTWAATANTSVSGHYAVRVKNATSCAGQLKGDLTAFEFDVDTTPPPPSPASLGWSLDATRTTVTLNWTPPADASRVVGYNIWRTAPGGGMVKIGSVEGSGSLTYPDDPPTGLPDNISYAVAAYDEFGQESLPVSVVVTLDNTPPEITITVGEKKYTSGSDTFVTGQTPITIQAADASGVASLSYNIDGGSFNDVTGNVTLGADRSDGAHLLTVTALDNYNNKRDTNLPLILDNAAPTAKADFTASGIIQLSGGYYMKAGNKVTVAADDGGGAGVAAITIDGQAYQANPATTAQGYGDGDHTITWFAEDYLVNSGAAKAETISVKSVGAPPLSSLSIMGAGYTAPDGRTFVRADSIFNLVSACVIPSGVILQEWQIQNQGGQLYGNNSRNTTNATIPIPDSLFDGKFTVSYRARDAVGNQEAFKSSEYYFDRSAPDVPVLLPVSPVYVAGGINYSGRDFTFGIQTADKPTPPNCGLAKVEYEVRDSGGTLLSSGSIPDYEGNPAQQVTYTSTDANDIAVWITCKATDNLGQVAVSAPYGITLAANPPQMAVVFAPSANVFLKSGVNYLPSGVNINIQSSLPGPPVSAEYQIKDGSGNIISDFQAMPSLGVDSSGLPHDQDLEMVYRKAETTDTNSIRIFVDTMVPSAVLVPPTSGMAGGFVHPQAQFAVDNFDAGSGVKSVMVSQDDGVHWQILTGAFGLGGADRQVKMRVKAADNTGNEYISPAALIYQVDGTPPVTSAVTTGLSVVNGAYFAPAGWQFTLQPVDAGSGIAGTEARDNGFTMPAKYGVYTLSEPGLHNIQFRSTDNVGNTEGWKSLTVTIVSGGPSTPANLVAEVLSSKGVKLSWSPAASAGVVGYEVYDDASGVLLGFVPAGQPTQFIKNDLTPYQDAVISVKTKDGLGNLSTAATVTVQPYILQPVINMPSIVSTLDVVIRGKSEPGADIYISMGGQEELLTSLPLGGDGSFNVVKTFSLSTVGTANISFIAKIYAGQIRVSAPTNLTVLFDMKPAKPGFLPLLTENLDTRVIIVWTRINEPDIDHYDVFRDGSLVPLMQVKRKDDGENPSITDWALTNGRKYTYRVEAVDNNGNRSGLSDPIDATPVAGPEWGQ